MLVNYKQLVGKMAEEPAFNKLLKSPQQMPARGTRTPMENVKLAEPNNYFLAGGDKK